MEEVKRSPGRPKKDEPIQELIKKAEPGKILAKTVQLGLGLDLLGSTLSLNHRRGNELEVTPIGIKATSAKNGRVVIIPWANIKGVELLPNGAA